MKGSIVTRSAWTKNVGLVFTFLVGIAVTPGLLQAEATSDVLATVGEKSISEADIAKQIKGQMLRLDNQIYSLKKKAIDTIINNHLMAEEAEKRGITRQQLTQQEVTDKVAVVTDKEVTAYYTKNKALLRGKKLEEVQDQVKQTLQSQKQQQRQREFTAELRKTATIDIKISPPVVEVPIADAPTRGPANAPITLVEFSDFQ